MTMELVYEETHCYRFDEATQVTPNSELYKALDVTLGRTVAIKKVKIQGENKSTQKINLNKALQEVKTMTQIAEVTSKIPNIYSCHYDEAANDLYIVMQWISGETLTDKMKRQVPIVVFLKWLEELGEILELMSKRNFRHKDIKPDNIMFNQNDDLYLIDFNISVSVPNQMEGTPLYKAPEMGFGSMTTARDKVDMFSIGVILFEKVVGKIPQRMVDYDCYNQMGEAWDYFVKPIDVIPGINKDLNNLIIKLMEYNPKNRFRSFSEMVGEMRRVERNIRNEGKPRKRY